MLREAAAHEERGERGSHLLNPPPGSTDPERFATVWRRLAACKTLGATKLTGTRPITSATGAYESRAVLIRGVLGLVEAHVLRIAFVWACANLTRLEEAAQPRTKSDRSSGHKAARMTTHTPSTPVSPLLALPDDVLQRVLVGVPLDDHCTTALVCQAFRGVITGSRFPALRQKYGFAERAIVLVGSVDASSSGIRIRIVNKSGVVASLSGPLHVDRFSSTTDGARLFFTTLRHGRGCGVVLVVDCSSRRWRQFTTLPHTNSEQRFHCVEWHNGCLYVAGGWRGRLVC